MQITNSIIGVLALGLIATPVAARGLSPAELCLDASIREAAAESVGDWAQQFPFTKALIGADGRFGYVDSPRAAEKDRDGVICHASFNLARVGRSGRAYAVAIADFVYRITDTGKDGYTIAPANLPNAVSGGAETLALIDRFTVDGRPYRETIADNPTRLQQRNRP